MNGSTIYVGGSFRRIAGKARSGIAALSTFSGKATAWNPGYHKETHAIAAVPNRVYIDGSTAFEQYDSARPLEIVYCKPVISRGQVKVKWMTDVEPHIVGFNILRSNALDGEYSSINPVIIPALGSAMAGARYKFTDEDVLKPGQTYYYILEHVDDKGMSRVHGPFAVANAA